MKKKSVKAKKEGEHSSYIKIDLAGVLHFREYVGSIGYDSSENMFFGKVMYINDAILFSSDTIEGLALDFENVIEDYLSLCEKEGLQPNKPMSGVFNVRTSPENHYCLSVISKREKTTLNNVLNEAIKDFISLKWGVAPIQRR
jgi:predicted HicB family RNase H-like nuclease